MKMASPAARCGGRWRSLAEAVVQSGLFTGAHFRLSGHGSFEIVDLTGVPNHPDQRSRLPLRPHRPDGVPDHPGPTTSCTTRDRHEAPGKPGTPSGSPTRSGIAVPPHLQRPPKHWGRGASRNVRSQASPGVPIQQEASEGRPRDPGPQPSRLPTTAEESRSSAPAITSPHPWPAAPHQTTAPGATP